MSKICFIASSGGHLEEISKLKRIKAAHEGFLVTEKCDDISSSFCEKVYQVVQTNRKELLFPFKLIYLFFNAIKILHKEKPEYIITTGALLAYPFCLVGRLLSIKIVFIESFARVKDLSLTGRLLYKHSDLFIVQWEDLVKKYPKVKLGGGIF